MKKLAGFLAACLLVLIGSQSSVIAQTFTKGDIVEVYNTGGIGLRVRNAPCGDRIGNEPDGSIGIILEGPIYCVLEGTGYYWWRIRWSDGMEGWSAQNWLRRVLLPSITSASSSPNTIPPGGTVTLIYNVTNPGKEIGGAIAPLLGASIQPSGGGSYLSDPANDRKATIPSGSSSISRPFVVPATAAPGTYDLLVSLVADVNNNGRIDSEDRAWDLKRFSGVLQVRVTCTYSIFPTSQSFASAGGSGSVNVTAPSGCPWTATSNASWITITSGSSGNGNGTVNYSVASNPSTTPRTGTMTIAGQTFTVTQDGTPPPGTIQVNATLNGATWSGSVSYRLTGPQTIDGTTVPATFSNRPTGSYTLNYQSGGPSGATLTSITPSATQTLSAGGTITFTLNFSTPSTNQPPVINSLTANPSIVSPGGTSTISVSASDPENDPLTYTWFASCGTLSSVTGSDNKTWVAPNMLRTCIITVSVTDNKAGHSPVSKSVAINELPATQGKISWFSSAETNNPGAWGEWLGVCQSQDDATRYWYVAMRWKPWDAAGRVWWHNKKILVTNPRNGKAVVLAAKDWGPAEWTGRVIDVSKRALEELGVKTDDVVNIDFADQNASLGPISTPSTIPEGFCVISGRVTSDGSGLAGVTMTLSGDASRTTTTDANGNYSFNNLLPGSYIITPSKPGYTFSPTGRSVTISNANISGQDFTALVILPTVCTGVTVTSSPSSVTYTKKNQTKYIYVTITNNSGASRIVTTIAKQSDEPFTIKSISPSLPYTIRNGSSRTFSIRTLGPASGLPVTATSPYFNITLDCGTLSTAGLEMLMSEQQLQVTDLRAMALGQELVFSAVGDGIASLQVELFDLSGRKVFDSGEVQGNTFIWNLQNNAGRWLANGVYLYVVRVRGFNGKIYTSEVRKLAIWR